MDIQGLEFGVYMLWRAKSEEMKTETDTRVMSGVLYWLFLGFRV